MEKGIPVYKKLFEKRRHRRAPLSFPVTIKSPQGPIKGTTDSISVSGLSLLFLVGTPDIGHEFDITIKLSEDYEMSVFCERVWSGKINYKKTMYNAFRVEFINMSSNDRKLIASLVEAYYQN